jgi:uncharacterized protein with NAD-binding domain and iron-sulfur cluster
MKCIIFGGGPCGMRLADNLSDQGHQVELYERKDQLGGCWKVEWKDGYFTEHSPRVMSTEYSRVGELVDEKIRIVEFTELNHKVIGCFLNILYPISHF